MEDVQLAMQDNGACTVHTLSSELYTGNNDIPWAQGHIPGSVNHSFDDLLEDSAFLANDELALRLLDKAPGERIITYCGGGIAATVNAVAYLLAGNENVAVYDGSLFEWMGEGLPLIKGTEPR
jgi:thiosulfate/3-mercaptopyruvate sulfurtransferase